MTQLPTESHFRFTGDVLESIGVDEMRNVQLSTKKPIASMNVIWYDDGWQVDYDPGNPENAIKARLIVESVIQYLATDNPTRESVKEE